MKNTRYFPFERNRFFYGKLLTVRDFESEQKYNNDKRRLINRLLFGSGVVCGLQVVAIDDKTITVENGVALDGLGREIVVSTPVTQKLSLMEGFSNNEYAKNVYLCIAYDEKGKEPVHSVANSNVRSSEISEYNRIQECYKLFIKEEAPDFTAFDHTKLLETSGLIYRDGQVSIWQVAPKNVNPGEIFDVVLRVEKNLQTARIGFEYDLQCENIFSMDGQSTVRVSFSEGEHSQETKYEMKIKLRAGAKGEGRLTAKSENAKLSLDDKDIDVYCDCTNNVDIIDMPVREKILDSYFAQSLEQCTETNQEQCIYLAKISMLQVGPSYMIEKVERVPFGEYVHNVSLLQKMGILEENILKLDFDATASVEELKSTDKPRVDLSYDKSSRSFNFRIGIPSAGGRTDNLRTGIIEIDASEKLKGNSVYYTDEIEHGLGQRDVIIRTAVETTDDDMINKIEKKERQIFSGDYELFEKSPYEAEVSKISTGIVLYPKRGTFRMAVKLRDSSKAKTIKIRWYAESMEEI